MADEHDSWLEGIGVDVAGVMEDVAQTAEQTASSVGNSVADAASSASDAVSEVVSSAEQTGSTIVEGVEQAGTDLAQSASTGLETIEDGAVAAGEAVGDFAGEVGEGIEDAATTVANGLSDAASTVADGVESVATGVADTVSDLYDEAKQAVEGVDLPYQFGGIQAPIVKQLEETASEGHPVEARGLTSGELADAKLIFGDSLDYGKIVVDGGSVASLGACRTIGNTVHLTPDLFEPDSSETTTEGKRTLVHELTHVWQYQHTGWTYAPKALWAQAKAAVKGSRNGAYDWKPLVAKGTPWEEWNPEAQAQAVEDYNGSLHKVKDGTAKREDYDNLSILAKYVRMVASTPAAS